MNVLTWLTGEHVAAVAVTIGLQVTFVLTVTCCIACAIRRNAAARHAVCLAGLLLAVACPLLAANAGAFGWTWLRVDWPVEKSAQADLQMEPLAVDEPAAMATWEQAEDTWTPPQAELLVNEPQVPMTDSITVPPDVLYRPGDAGSLDESEADTTGDVSTSATGSSPEAVAFAPPVDPVNPASSGGANVSFATILRTAVGYGLLVWLLGVVVQVVRWMFTRWRLKTMLREAAELDESRFGGLIAEAAAATGLWTPPRVLTGPLVPVPLVYGVLRPRVLLPRQFVEDAEPSEIRDVLIHEIAHVARRDCWISLLQRLAAVVYWPHVLVHVLNRQLAAAREELCDNYVLREGRGTAFAELLVSLSEEYQPVRVPVGLLGLVSRNNRLEARVAGLLDRRRRTGTRMRRCSLALLVAGGLLLIGATAGIRAGGESSESGEGTVVESSGDALEADPSEEADALSSETESSAQVSEDTHSYIRGVVTDESGNPVFRAIVKFSLSSLSERRTTTDRSGRFDLPIPPERQRRSWELIAQGPAGERLGLASVDDSSRRGDLSTQVLLRPARIVTAHVQDDLGRPVPGAIVTVVGGFVSIGEGVTDASGSVNVRYPEGADVQWLLARSDGVGFDYFQNNRSRAVLHPGPLPEEVTLRLDGARSVEVRVVNSAGEPVTEAYVYAWTIKKPRKTRHANLGGVMTFPVDAEGTVHFDCLPREFDGAISFVARGQGIHAPEYAGLRPGDDKTRLTIEVLRDARISGRVTHADGTSADGIRVIAFGVGYSSYSGNETSTFTDDEGRYEIPVDSNAAYLVGVRDDEWAAASRNTDLLDEDESVENLDLTLIPGTLITGEVTEGDDRLPVEHEYVLLSQEGEELPEITGRPIRQHRLLYRGWTDEAGRYSFRVGPGEYRLRIRDERPHGNEPLRITGDGGRLEFDQHFEGPRFLSLSGRVVNNADGSPLANASVYVGRAGDDAVFPTRMLATTDADGHFRIDRLRPQNMIYAHSADGGLASFMIVGPETSEMTLELYPAVTVVGQLRDDTGKPLANVDVAGYVRSPNVESESAAIHTTTDRNGRYRISGVAVGALFELVPMGHFYGGGAYANPVRIFNEPGEVEIDPFIVPKTVEATDPDRIMDTRRQILTEIEQSADEGERRLRLHHAMLWARELLADTDRDPGVLLNATILLASLDARPARLAGDTEQPAVPYVPVYPVLIATLQDESCPESARMWAAIGLGRICRDADPQVHDGELEEPQREQIALALAHAVEEKINTVSAGETSPTANRYGMRLVEALGMTGVSGDRGAHVVDTLIDVIRHENLGLYVRAEAARGLGWLPVDRSNDFEPRLTAIAKLAVQLAEAPLREDRNSSVHQAAGNVHLAFKPYDDAEAARGWGLLTQASRFAGDEAAAEVDRLYQLTLPIVNGILKNRNIPQADVHALKSWIAERDEDPADQPGAENSRLDTSAIVDPSLIDKLSEHCQTWINSPTGDLRSLQYTYTLGNDERRVELVRGVSAVRRGMWYGATLTTGLHWLLAHPDRFDVTVVRLESDSDEPSRLQLTIRPKPEQQRMYLEIGNGISGSWRGYFSHPSDEMTLEVDAERMLPLRETHKLGSAAEITEIRYGDWEQIGDDHWIPRLVDVLHDGAVYHMHFAWQGGAAWLLTHAETEYEGKLNQVAQVSDVVVNDAALIRRVTEEQQQRKEAAGIVRTMLDHNRAWLAGDLSGLKSLSYTFHTLREDVKEQCVLTDDGAVVMEVTHDGQGKMGDRLGERQTALPTGEWARAQGDDRFALIHDPSEQKDGQPYAEQIRHYGLIGCQLDLPVFRYDKLLAGANVDVEDGEWNGTPCHVATVRSLGRDVYLGCGTMLGFTSWSYVHHIRPAYETISIDKERNVPLHETLISSGNNKRFEIDFADYEEIAPGQWAPRSIRVESPGYFTCELKFQLLEGRHWLLSEVESWFDLESKSRGVVEDLAINQPSELHDAALKQIEATRAVFGGDDAGVSQTVEVPTQPFALGQPATVGPLDVLFTLNAGGGLVLRCTSAEGRTVDEGHSVSVLLLDDADRVLSAADATFAEQDGQFVASAEFGRSTGLARATRYLIAIDGKNVADQSSVMRPLNVRPAREAADQTTLSPVTDESGKTSVIDVAIRPGEDDQMVAAVHFASRDRLNEFGLDVSVGVFNEQSELIASGAKQGTLMVKSNIVEETWEIPLPHLARNAEFDRVAVGFSRGQTYSAPMGTLWGRFGTIYPIFSVETMLAAEDPGCWQVGLEDLETEIRDNVLRRGLLDSVREWKEQVAEKRTPHDVLRPDVERLLSIAERTDEPQILAAAIRLLGLSGDPRAVTAVRAHLTSDDPGVRDVTAIALGILGQADALPGIESVLNRDVPSFADDPDAYRRYRVRSDDALTSLVALRTDESIALVRKLLMESWGTIEHVPRETGGFSWRGRHTPEVLAKLMGCLPDPRYVSVLTEAITSIDSRQPGEGDFRPDDFITSLHEYGDAAREFIVSRVREGDLSVLPSRDPYYVPAVRDVMLAADTDSQTIYRGVRYLWNAGTDEAVQALRDTFENRLPDDRRTRMSLCEALAYCGDDRGLPDAFEALVAACQPEVAPEDSGERRKWERARERARDDSLDVFKRAKSGSRVAIVERNQQTDDVATRLACLQVLQTLRGAMSESVQETLVRWKDSDNEEVATEATLLLQRGES